MADNGRALRCWGIWNSSARNRCPIEKLKMKIRTKSYIEKLLPEPQPNSEPLLMGIASAPILQNPLLAEVLKWRLTNLFLNLSQILSEDNFYLIHHKQ
jgi:hypothetical protein